MSFLLTCLRERYPKHWGIRLMLGITLLGLMLGSASMSQMHMHADADPGHSHEHLPGGEQSGGATMPDDSTSGSLHFHDVASPMLNFGSASTFDGSLYLPPGWVPSENLSPPPPAFQSTPHRPPIA